MIVTKKISDTRVKIRVAIFIFILLTPLWVLIIVDGWLFSKAKVIDGTLKYKGNEYYDWGLDNDAYVVCRENEIGYRYKWIAPINYYSLIGDNENNIVVEDVKSTFLTDGGQYIYLKNGVTYNPDSEITGLVYNICTNDGKEFARYIEDEKTISIIKDIFKLANVKKISKKAQVGEISMGLCHSNLPIGLEVAQDCEICYCEDGSWVIVYDVDITHYYDVKEGISKKIYGQQYQITNQDVIEILNGFMSELSK